MSTCAAEGSETEQEDDDGSYVAASSRLEELSKLKWGAKRPRGYRGNKGQEGARHLTALEAIQGHPPSPRHIRAGHSQNSLSSGQIGHLRAGHSQNSPTSGQSGHFRTGHSQNSPTSGQTGHFRAGHLQNSPTSFQIGQSPSSLRHYRAGRLPSSPPGSQAGHLATSPGHKAPFISSAGQPQNGLCDNSPRPAKMVKTSSKAPVASAAAESAGACAAVGSCVEAHADCTARTASDSRAAGLGPALDSGKHLTTGSNAVRQQRSPVGSQVTTSPEQHQSPGGLPSPNVQSNLFPEAVAAVVSLHTLRFGMCSTPLHVTQSSCTVALDIAQFASWRN